MVAAGELGCCHVLTGAGVLGQCVGHPNGRLGAALTSARKPWPAAGHTVRGATARGGRLSPRTLQHTAPRPRTLKHEQTPPPRILAPAASPSRCECACGCLLVRSQRCVSWRVCTIIAAWLRCKASARQASAAPRSSKLNSVTRPGTPAPPSTHTDQPKKWAGGEGDL